MAASASQKELTERTFEDTWIIKNWKQVVQEEVFTESTTTEIRLEAENIMYAKFLIGTTYDQIKCVGFYWKLLWKHQCLNSVNVSLVMDILTSTGKVGSAHKIETNAEIGMTMDILKSFWARSNADSLYSDWTNSKGSLEIRLKLSLKDLPHIDAVCLSKTTVFREKCKEEYSQNMSILLDDKVGSDVKIVTKDKTELLAHKAILRARCPVFAAMFGSECLENSTGIVNADDISTKTMKILLNYWYTGELQPFWKDDDTIAEFAYTAGKYQMASVLEMLDDFLGIDLKPVDGDLKLLRMVQQLSLKNAETRIFNRLVHNISQTANGIELLGLFSSATDTIDEASFTVFQILKTCNDVMCENDKTDATCHDVKLMALACKLGMKNVETKLLKRIIATVSEMNSADELFALLGLDIQEHDIDSVSENSESRDLLVRVKPK